MKRIVLFFSLLTLLVFYPLLLHPASRIPDDSDGLLGAWTIARVQQNILENKPLFFGGTFFPHPNTILFSDVFVTSAVLSLPLRMVTQEPLAFYTFSLVCAFFLTLLFSFLFFREVIDEESEGNSWLACVCAVVFTLSQIHMRYLAHLHMFALQYVLMSMWAAIRFCRTGKKKWIVVSMIGAVLQVWQSLFLVYYSIFFALGCLFVPSYRQRLLSQWKFVCSCVGVFLLFCAPLVLAYYQFSQDYHVVRDIREAIHFSLIFPDLWQQFFSPVVYILMLLAAFVGIKKQKPGKGRMFLLLGLFIFCLTLGPVLHWGTQTVKPIIFGHVLHVPLPYTLFYYLAPGFKAFRTPSRFLPLATLMFLSWSLLVLKRNRFIYTYREPLGILACGISLILCVPLHTVSVPSFTSYPTRITVLQNRPEQVLLKLPLRNWADPRANEDTYEMLYSLKHGKTLVNGQSGFFPAEWMQFQNTLQTSFPSSQAVDEIRKRGVDILEIDMKYYDRSEVLKYVVPVFESSGWMVALLQ